MKSSTLLLFLTISFITFLHSMEDDYSSDIEVNGSQSSYEIETKCVGNSIPMEIDNTLAGFPSLQCLPYEVVLTILSKLDNPNAMRKTFQNLAYLGQTSKLFLSTTQYYTKSMPRNILDQLIPKLDSVSLKQLLETLSLTSMNYSIINEWWASSDEQFKANTIDIVKNRYSAMLTYESQTEQIKRERFALNKSRSSGDDPMCIEV